MFESLQKESEELRKRLANVIERTEPVPTPHKQFSSPVDVVVTPNEVNLQHGTGVLLTRIFGAGNGVVSIRTMNNYGEVHNFGEAAYCLPCTGMSREDVFRQVYQWLRGVKVRNVICVPFLHDDLIVAIAAKEIFHAPLCIYIMDDHNLFGGGIPHTVMREALEKASLRLAISPEMQRAYESKYRVKFWLLPPVVSPDLVRTTLNLPVVGSKRTGVMIGNIWGQRWLDLLRATIRESGFQIDWYCNNPGATWLAFSKDLLKRDGIALCDPLPEKELSEVLSRHTFALVPSGTMDESDDNRKVAQLSLPTRIPFIVATSHTPIIVMGNPNVASARFVQRFGLGLSCGYTAAAFRTAVEEILRPETQSAIRTRACDIGPLFSAEGIANWIWSAMELGEPSDLKYEKLMPLPRGESGYYVDPPAPNGMVDDFIPVYKAFSRLKRMGYTPDFSIDVGASVGIWSDTVHHVFPHCRFVLVEPLASRYDKVSRELFTQRYNFEVVECALSDREGLVSLKVSGDLYASSLLHISSVATLKEVIQVSSTTMDALAEEKKISGRGIVKIDAQWAEHLVLNGGRSFLAAQVDIVVLELTFGRQHPEAKTFLEMLNFMRDLGFEYFDDAGEWRDPNHGILEQKDVLFARCGLFKRELE